MDFLGAVLGRSSADTGFGGALSDFWYQPVGQQSATGININADTALGNSAVWAACDRLASGLGQLPLIIYQRNSDGGKSRATQHPVFDLLRSQPNPRQTAFTWKRMSMVHALLWGNAYSLKVPGPRGPVDTLVPLHPDGVRVEKIPSGIRYRLRQPDGTEKTVNEEDVFHIPGLSLDGISGLSVIQYAREEVALGLAARQHQALNFGQGTRIGGFLKVKGKLNQDAADRLKARWSAANSGLQSTGKTAVLDDDADWVSTGMTAVDAALVATLEWSVTDIARRFNVPLHMLQQTTRDTSWGSGIEQMQLAFVTFCLMPWATNWSDEIGRSLLLAPRTYFAEFLFDALLRGSTAERFGAYQVAAGGTAPWMTRNEIRLRENMNPLPGLDSLLVPLNYSTLGPNGQPPPPQPNQGMPDQQPPGAEGQRMMMQLYARAAAARVVRREQKALERIASRNLGEQETAQAVWDFYAAHTAAVQEQMLLSESAAADYVGEQHERAVTGTELGDDWERESAERLMARALGAAAARVPGRLALAGEIGGIDG